MSATQRLAAIYSRVSTEEQTKGQVTSTKTQVARCREKAAALNLPVAPDDSGLIIEEQHSGADLRWEGTKFMALVRRAERHEFTDLICYDLDRFCRGGSDAYGVQRGLLSEAGVRIHYVNTDLGREDNPFRGTLEALFADAAQMERDKTRERSMRVRTATAEAGFITAGAVPPFGFRWIEDATQKTKRGSARKIGLEPDPVTGPALLHVTEHVANGGSIYTAREWLTEQQILTPRGGSLWYISAIRRILHNPTNYGGRRSFETRVVERDKDVRREKHLKTRMMQIPRPVDEQYEVKADYVTPIPGLTYDLWRRALARLAENKAYSLRNAKQPLAERVQHGLLRGPMIRCALCGHALALKHTPAAKRSARAQAVQDEGAQPERWRNRYVCSHTSTRIEGEGTIAIEAAKLDTLVWDIAADCLRDPDYFTRLLAESDAANGPAVRVASLTRQLTETASTREKLMRQLERLDADDELVPMYQAKLRENEALRDELTRDRAAAQTTADAEDARRATISAFTRYAETKRERLDSYTALQRHELLRALRTRVILDRATASERILVTFDLRGLPAGVTDAFNMLPDLEQRVALPYYLEGERAPLPRGSSKRHMIDLSDAVPVDILTESDESIVERLESSRAWCRWWGQ